MEGFSQWLRKQRRRDDCIGQYARWVDGMNLYDVAHDRETMAELNGPCIVEWVDIAVRQFWLLKVEDGLGRTRGVASR